MKFAESGDATILGQRRHCPTPRERCKMLIATDYARKMALDLMRLIASVIRAIDPNNKASRIVPR